MSRIDPTLKPAWRRCDPPFEPASIRNNPLEPGNRSVLRPVYSAKGDEPRLFLSHY